MSESLTIRELSPKDGRKSFHGKAHVLRDERGMETLYSYNTPILKDIGGVYRRLFFGNLSATTARHVKAFCGMDRAQFLKLGKEA